MEKQQLRGQNFDNGFQKLFERYPALKSKYVKGTIAHLHLIPGARIYDRHQVRRVVTGEVPLNSDNKVIKDAFVNRAKELIPDFSLN